MSDEESWEPELEELRRRQALGRAMGGPEKLERQRANDRLNVRERIDRLVDPGSFERPLRNEWIPLCYGIG